MEDDLAISENEISSQLIGLEDQGILAKKTKLIIVGSVAVLFIALIIIMRHLLQRKIQVEEGKNLMKI